MEFRYSDRTESTIGEIVIDNYTIHLNKYNAKRNETKI